jgi:polyhydroxyalkanoate synthase
MSALAAPQAERRHWETRPWADRSLARTPAARPAAVVEERRAVTPTAAAAEFDRLWRALVMRRTLGRSPVSLGTAFADWFGHLAFAPTVQRELAIEAWEAFGRFCQYGFTCAFGAAPPRECCVAPLPQDTRFADPAWQRWPFNLIHQGFLAQEQWWQKATTAVPGVSKHHALQMSFVVRQVLDQFAPSNFVATNPVVLRETAKKNGRNLWDGARHLVEDSYRLYAGEPPVGTERFKVGETVAVTPGKVVFRNDLIELIQYAPQTETVHPEPILIVPAWIMKYYILDLSPENSLIDYLVKAGFSVFSISWRNPGREQQGVGIDDYIKLGIGEALTAVRSIVLGHPVHAVGYCIGGTLLAIAAAALGRQRNDCLGTLTLFAAQTDFADAGELTLFVDESEVTFLDDMMWLQGVLDAKQMAGAFRLLRSNDLIWSRVVRDYLLGERTPVTDLVAWSSDATRIPYRVHRDYLRRLFLDNDFAAGRLLVDGVPVGLSNIRLPTFVVGTTWDHIAPWKSVYKIHLQANGDITFVLAQGGHNTAIVNPPPGAGRGYRIDTRAHNDPYMSPDEWIESHQPQAGSWWPAWVDWLRRYSSEPTVPPAVGSALRGYPPLGDAPGTYVHER